MNMSFSRRNVEKLGFSRTPPDVENDDSGLGFFRGDTGSAVSDGGLTDVTEQPRTQSVLSLLSWGDDEFERESTREVERMLADAEKLLYEGETAEEMSTAVQEECMLWRDKFPHFRVLGRRVPVLPSRPRSGAVVPVMLLTENGPVDEETASCLRYSGAEETIARHGPHPPVPAAGDSLSSNDAEPTGPLVSNPSALIQDMVKNSLVSLLWSDYVNEMAPVFQLSAESADSMKLTSISREVSARARRHSDPGGGVSVPPPPPAPAPPAERGRGGRNRAPVKFDRQFGCVAKPAADKRAQTKSRSPSRDRAPLPPVRPPGGARAALGGPGPGHGRRGTSRSALPRISPSTETTRQVAPVWSRHRGRAEALSFSLPNPPGAVRGNRIILPPIVRPRSLDPLSIQEAKNRGREERSPSPSRAKQQPKQSSKSWAGGTQRHPAPAWAGGSLRRRPVDAAARRRQRSKYRKRRRHKFRSIRRELGPATSSGPRVFSSTHR